MSDHLIAEANRHARALTAERDQLHAELEKVYALVAPDGCDLAPRGLFETARAVTELRAEVERLRGSCEFADFQRQQARAERAEAELATERARLDWIEENAGDMHRYNSSKYIWFSHQNLRAAIDAAMKEETK